VADPNAQHASALRLKTTALLAALMALPGCGGKSVTQKSATAKSAKDYTCADIDHNERAAGQIVRELLKSRPKVYGRGPDAAVYYQQRVTEPCIHAVAKGIPLKEVKPYEELK
jgi:hypothetical protein